MMMHEYLAFTMEDAWTYLRQLVDGLTDEEFFWEPAPNCWRIYRTAGGSWTYDYALPPPAPAPITTIGWRLVHIASCKVIYYEYAFGAAKLTFPELVIPHSAAGALAWLEEGHAQLRAALESCPEGRLDRPLLTNWGEHMPAWRWFWILIKHDIQHGAEIGALRDLYRERR